MSPYEIFNEWSHASQTQIRVYLWATAFNLESKHGAERARDFLAVFSEIFLRMIRDKNP